MRILYIHSTYVPPAADGETDRFLLLSATLEGEVLHPIWTADPANITKLYGAGSFPAYKRGRFRYHWILDRDKGFRRTLSTLRFCLNTGLRLHREKPFDCIVTYSHMTTALIGVVLKLLTGARLIVEVATSPDLVYITERPRPSLRDRVMKAYSDLCLHISLLIGDRAHVLYPEALKAYPLLRRVPISLFHEFVPVSAISPAAESGEPFILLVGAPWYLKGVDLLLEAFRALAPDFPNVGLKIVGHYPDDRELRALADGLPRVEILKAMHYREILDLIARARVLVLPSRCEGMGRVLIEAMAAGVPVIGSDVGGIPHMIHQGENGLVFPAGDWRALEACLRQVLGNEDLRRKLGARGRQLAQTLWNERVYVEEFTRMAEAAGKAVRAPA